MAERDLPLIEDDVFGELDFGGKRPLRHAMPTQQEAMLQAIERHFPAGTRAIRHQDGYFI